MVKKVMSLLQSLSVNSTAESLSSPSINNSPNFVNTSTLATTSTSIGIFFLILTLFFVTIRLFANSHAPRGLGIDDCFCLIATISFVTFVGLDISLNRYARHKLDIPLGWIDSRFYKLHYAADIMRAPTLFFGNGAILLLYLRIFTVDKKMRYSIRLGILWSFCIYWLYVPVTSVYCAPPPGQTWSVYTIPNCDKMALVSIIQSALTIPLDMYIFILPIPTVLRLQMSPRRRISVLCIFSTALLGIVAAVVRLVYSVEAYRNPDDALWKTIICHICVVCESSVAITVSSMPAFASIFKGNISNFSWLKNLKSFVLKPKPVTSSDQRRAWFRSNIQTLSEEVILPENHIHEDRYIDFNANRLPMKQKLASVTTYIRRDSTSSLSFEEEVAPTTIAIHHPIRKERSIIL